MEYDRNLFGEIKNFIQVVIVGKEYTIPDRLEMLRVFQFLNFTIDYSRLCWNASCQRCYIELVKQGKTSKALACRLRSSAEMQVTRLPAAIRTPE